MFIRSTGLGRTLLRGRIVEIQTTGMIPSTLESPSQGATEPARMLMVMEIIHPVHWTVRAFMDPDDLRHMIWLILKNPMLILRGVKFLFSKSPSYETAETAETPIAGSSPAGAPKPDDRQASAVAPKQGPGPIPPKRGPGPIPKRQ